QPLGAGVACLVNSGYAGPTTQRVQERAYLSRGALLHHFASKAELLVAAIHLIADERLKALHAAADGIEPGPRAFAQVVNAIQDAMSGPPFVAALALWMRSRADTELPEALVPAERRLGRELPYIFTCALGDADSRQARVAFNSLVVLLRGLAVTSVLRDDAERSDEVINYWLQRMAPTKA